MSIKWKVARNGYGEDWIYNIGCYQFKIAFPNFKIKWEDTLPFCFLFIDMVDESHCVRTKLEENSFDSFVEANAHAEKVLSLILESDAYKTQFETSATKTYIERLGLYPKVENALKKAGIEFIEDIEEMKDDRLLQVRGIGKRMSEYIKDELKVWREDSLIIEEQVQGEKDE